MTIKQPFAPHYGSNQVLAAGATATAASISHQAKQMRVVNTGANKAYFRTYDSGNTPVPVASVADYCVPPGLAATVSKIGHNAISIISATGTTLEVMTGEGF
jgi:hypothetical protein